MRVTVQGLRRWIAIAAALLLAVVAGFFLYGRYRFRHIEKDLPGRLGVDIQQTANGFSYTQSNQGHPLFTLKASKELQLKSGHVLLHDVDITLFGPPGSGRTDRIFGSDFDYDQNQGLAVSRGDVDIELQGTSTPTAQSASGGDADSNTIRVRTRGLTFAQKTGEATTTQAVEFQLPRGAGSAVGADYNSKSGVLVLDSHVHVTTSSNGKAAVIEAAHATLLRASYQASLVNASLNYETEEGRADQAVIYFRKDGTTEKVDAQGHVHMKTDTGATVESGTAHILMDLRSQPTQADLDGGVQFDSQRDNDTMHGSAASGTLLFSAAPGPQRKTALRHAEFRHEVSFEEEISGLSKDPRGHAEKQMHAEKVDIEFAAEQPGHSVEASKAFAEGSPVLTSKQTPSKGPEQTTRISGDHLVATLGEENTLRQLEGTGHTQVVESATDGSENTTKGDVLHATFGAEQRVVARKPGPPVSSTYPNAAAGTRGQAASGTKGMQTMLETAAEDGNVELTELPAKKPGATTQPAKLMGWARHAEYHAAEQVIHLSGDPRITDGGTMQMAAASIDYHRDTQNALAAGNVKATYTQPKSGADAQPPAPVIGFGGGGNGPVHVIAERATMDHATNRDVFYGAGHAPARMWQEADSLLAPVIEIDRNQDLLRAWGEGTGTAPVVNANFTSGMGGRQPSVVRVHSETLVYSDKKRQGDFHGTVTAEQGNEAIHADDALVFLKPEAKPGQNPPRPGAASSAVETNSQLDHLIAAGHVIFAQPGRKGTGEKLVYTADDGRYVLTGTASTPPVIVDQVHGTTTGEALIFNNQDDNVVVSGGKSSAVTETRAPK